MIKIFDSNNYVRQLIERDPSGLTPRTILNSMVIETDTCFFIWDSQNSLKARRKIYPGYKVGRPDLSADTYVNFEMVQNVLSLTNAIQITMDGYEADDIIACLARSYASRGTKVHIYSTDRDFLQLLAEYPDHITCTAALKEGVMLSDIRYHKTLVGDASDKIPGIKGFGAGAWDKIEDKTGIKAWLDQVVSNTTPDEFVWGGKASNDWANDPENQKTLQSYWEIIGFLPLREAQLAAHLKIGTPNFTAADVYLKGFMQ